MSDVITVIKPSHKLSIINFREVWQYRELLFSLVKRDIQVRYRQTIIGGLWAIIQPFSTMVIFSFFFGRVAGISSEGVPYPIFSYAGLLLWLYFTGSITAASNSLINNSTLITKVYFPRIIIPIAATITGIVDYLVASIILVCMMLFYNITPPWHIYFLPLTVVLTWILAMGVSFWLSAINVKYRDVGFVLPFFIQLLLFITPVIYPTSVAPNYKLLLAANPMTEIINAHRAMVLGNLPVNWTGLGSATVIIFIIFLTGSMYFKKVEKYFADII